MNYIIKPSLQQIALVKITAALWNQHDITDMVNFHIQSPNTELKERWPQMEQEVSGKVSQLPLPNLLKEKAEGFVRLIGFQILNCIEYHKRCLDICYVPDEFYFTSQGTIDEKKTAEMFIKDESIDIITRYKLACIYCLEDDILELWNKIPGSRRTAFCSELVPTHWFRERVSVWFNASQHDLVAFWTHNIKRKEAECHKVARRNSLYQDAFKYAARAGNSVATEYFLQKLTCVEKRESLISVARSVVNIRLYRDEYYMQKYLCDILFILLRQIDEEQQIEIFKNNPYVLEYFLDWPRQIFFMDIVSRMWNFITKELYDCLLFRIFEKKRDGYKDFNYQELLEEFWLQSPEDLKKYVLNALKNSRLNVHRSLYDEKHFLIALLLIRNLDSRKLIDQEFFNKNYT